MPHPADIKVYYAGGVSYVALGDDTFFSVSDDGTRRKVVKELPLAHSESSETSDNGGMTGSHARSLIATAREVAKAMFESNLLLAQS